MFKIFLYAIGVMYSPGPVNLIGLNSGLNGRFRQSIQFFAGVGLAMAILFLLFGYTGQAIIKTSYLPFIAIPGCLYILYLAGKIAFSSVEKRDVERKNKGFVSFFDGLSMQLLNPKAMLVIIPVTGVQFPAENIVGVRIFFFSLVLAFFAMWAPGSYSLLGQILGQKINNPRFFKVFNLIMAVLLIGVAVDLFYGQVYLHFVSEGS